jgi:hypothetical protein
VGGSVVRLVSGLARRASVGLGVGARVDRAGPTRGGWA